MEAVVMSTQGVKEAHLLEVAETTGIYSRLRTALAMKPEQITEEVKKSALRGRGGAGFPCGVKWGFVPKNSDKPVYLLINADEGEPGTFKDRWILNYNPHLMIEGIIISCFALKSNTCYIYIRGEFFREKEVVDQAIAAATAKGYLGENILGSGFSCHVYTHPGAGAYICGEETALIESLEGKKGQPRIKPPFPAVVGVFGCPTIVNNVETIASVPYIIEKGANAFQKLGTEKSGGPKMWSISGHVNKPGVYEVPMGLSMMEFINKYAGGVWKGRQIKAIIPGGSSCPILTADEARDVTMDYECIATAGSMLGSGGMIVMDDRTDMVEALQVLADFYHHESCGQCTPCREGSGWIKKILHRINDGRGTRNDLDMLLQISDNMQGRTICVFADALAMPVRSFVNKFRSEFEAKIKS